MRFLSRISVVIKIFVTMVCGVHMGMEKRITFSVIWMGKTPNDIQINNYITFVTEHGDVLDI